MHMNHPHGKVNMPQTPEEMSRRRFLGYLSGVLSGIIGLIMAVPLAGYVVSPLLKKKKELWVNLGPVSALTVGTPRKLTYSYQRIDGWFERIVHGTAYGVRLEEGPETDKIIVLSNICTHLGCGVRWDESRNVFLCPCHDGLFDIKGNVTGGPPPRPLSRYNFKVEDGMILIQFEEV